MITNVQCDICLSTHIVGSRCDQRKGGYKLKEQALKDAVIDAARELSSSLRMDKALAALDKFYEEQKK